MKKKVLTASLLAICAIALVVASVLTTIALLTSSASVSNVFTIGEVRISMYETKVNSEGKPVNASGVVIAKDSDEILKVDTNSYHLIPGRSYTKDPTIYINSTEQDDMYLFVKSSNMIRSAEAANFNDKNENTPKSMREQMIANGWVEFVRSGDGVEIVWVYGTRDVATGKITPTPVNKGTYQKRSGVDATVAGEFRLCESFTLHKNVDVNPYGAASVTFTAFAVQEGEFTTTGDPHALTTEAWTAIKESFPYNTGIINPINPYKSDVDAYVAVPGVADPWTQPLTPPATNNSNSGSSSTPQTP